MGRILKITKQSNVRWDNQNNRGIVESFVNGSYMKNVRYGNGRAIFQEKANFHSLGINGNTYALGTTKFIGVGNTFGCREGLVRDMQRANTRLSAKNSVLIVRDKMPVHQVTYREMFKEGWVDFLEDFLSHIDVSRKLVELFGMYNDSPGKISFPVTSKQSSTLSTVSSALILLTRNPTVFCRDRGKKGLRNYKEVIEELVHDHIGKSNRRKNGLAAGGAYTRNGANFILWNLLFYFDLLPIISKDWRTNVPNGPDTFVVYGARRIANEIAGLNKENKEEFFDMLGGIDSPIIRGFPSSINLAVRDMATAARSKGK